MEKAAEKPLHDNDRDESDEEVEVFSSNTSGEEDNCNVELSEVLSPEHAKKQLTEKVVYNEKDAYKLYRDYGRNMGFNVRKGKQYYYIGSRNIRKKYYYCSKEGTKIDKLNNSKFHRKDVRTGCKAFVQFTVDEKGQWKVTQLGVEHNHDLVKPKQRHVSKTISSCKSAEACSSYPAMHAEIHTSNADSGDGLAENCVSYVNSEQMAPIKTRENQNIISYFRQKSGENGMFYWDVLVDHEGRMGNIFWRDGRSRIDYNYFGDVLFFDKSSHVNKYEITFVIFMGVNHHWQNIMFGCAFLLDETEASFVWLLKTFLESMGNQPPKTVITNDDEALQKAIELVFPSTRHRFCLRRVLKTASLYFGNHSSSKKLLHLFDKCLHGCESEMEFEETWRKLVFEYGIEDFEWLNKLYMNRQKWCSAFCKDCFDGGIESSQRSENIENVLSNLVDRSTSRIEFAHEYEKHVEVLRQNEAKEDFLCRQNGPRRAIQHSDILKHVAKLYTHKIYKLFEEEFLDGCCAASFKEISCGGDLYRFELTMQGRDSKVWTVHIDVSKMELSCSCNKFNSMGVLCSHALKALSLKNVNKISDKYIIKRWTKDARKGIFKFDDTENEFIYRNLAIRYAYELVMRSEGHKQTRKIILDAFVLGEKELDLFFEKKCLDENSEFRENFDESAGEAADKMLKRSSPAKSNSGETKKRRCVDRHRGDEQGETYCSTFPLPCNATSAASQIGFFPSPSPGCFSPPIFTPLSQMPAQISNINWVLESPPAYSLNLQGNHNAVQNLNL